MTPDPEVIREIDALMSNLKYALHEFWEAHDFSCEFDEDRLPEKRRDATSKAILRRARADLERKTLPQLSELTGESRHAYTLHSRMVERYLEDAAAAVEAYFEDITYR